MSEQGVFAVHRGVFDHPMFAPEPYTEREAWLWLLSAAAWRATRVRVGKAIIDVARGQLAFAGRFLAVKWRWSHSRVVRFLKRLEIDTMISTLAKREATLITICNYNEYQFGGNATETQTDTPTGTEVKRERNKEEEDNNLRSNNSVANATGANAPDHRKRLFDEGLSKLAAMTGKGPDACRSFVGKCLKAASDDAIVVLGLIEDAERNRVADPSAWIAARLKPSTGPPGKPLTEHQRAQHETKDILNELGNFARGGSGSGAANPALLPDHSGQRPEGLRGGFGEAVIDLPRGGYRSSG